MPILALLHRPSCVESQEGIIVCHQKWNSPFWRTQIKPLPFWMGYQVGNQLGYQVGLTMFNPIQQDWGF